MLKIVRMPNFNSIKIKKIKKKNIQKKFLGMQKMYKDF